MPHAFPPWPTVYASFRRWEGDGTWERMAGGLRRDLRGALGRRAESSAAILDSQTVKTTEKGAPWLRCREENHRPQAPGARRYRGIPDGTGGPSGQHLRECRGEAGVDKGPGGRATIRQDLGRRGLSGWRGGLGRGRTWLPAGGGGAPARSHSFAVLPRRWVVERSFAWLGRYRRLSKDYEALTATSAAMIWAAASTTMLRRLAKRGSL